MNLLGISSSFSFALPMASAGLTALQSQVLTQIDQAEGIYAADPFDTDAFRTTTLPLTSIVEIREAATETIQLSRRYDESGASERPGIHGQIGERLSSMRETVRTTGASVVTPEAPDEAAVDEAEAFRRIVAAGPTSGMERLFGEPLPAGTDLPSTERLPEIRAYLTSHLESSGEVLERLDRIVVWGTPTREDLPGDVQDLLNEVEDRRATQTELARRLARLTTATAEALSRETSAHYLQVHDLETRIAAHPTLGLVFRSATVDGDWQIEGLSLGETATERELPGLSGFFRDRGIEPAYHGRIEILLRQYARRLQAKRGGSLGPLRDESFDCEAFATALTASFDETVVAHTLSFLESVWGQQVVDIARVRTEREHVVAELERLREERRPLFPERFTVAQPLADESIRRYISRLGIQIDGDLFYEVVGVKPNTAFSWGRNKRTPLEIGMVMHLYRYLVEEAWRRETLFARSAGTVQLPDPMELLRLAYGEWAEPFFENLADDPWVIAVPIPEGVFDLSYAEMFYGRVLQRLWEVHRLRSSVVSAGLRARDEDDDGEGDERRGLARSTLDRWRRGETMSHRRQHHSRGEMRRLLGPIGDVLDFFLEAKSIIDQVATVHLPGQRSLNPTLVGASNWSLRLAPTDADLMDLSAVTPTLDGDRHPYKYLEGERDDFTLLLGELDVRLDFLSNVQGRDPAWEVQIGEGESVTLATLRDSLDELATDHLRFLARLQYYRDHPEDTPFSAPQNFERFYRRLLLFARTVRNRITIRGDFEYGGLTIRYRIVNPGSAAEQARPITVQGRGEDPSIYDVGMTPDAFTTLARGEGLSAGEQRDLFRLHLITAVLRERGVLTEEDVPSLATRLLPDREAREREALVTQLQALERLEARTPETSRLTDTNEDVLTIYRRADRVIGEHEEIPPEQLERWLRERFIEFSWNRFGIPPLRTQTYLAALARYCELHPAYAEAFDPALFEQAVQETAGEGLQVRRILLEFLFFVGMPTAEEVARRSATPLPVPPPDLPPAPATAPRPADVGTVYPSRQGLIVDDFLDRQELTSISRETLRAVLLQLTPFYVEASQGRRRITDQAAEEQIRTILAERARFLAVADLEPSQASAVIVCCQAFLRELAAMGSAIDSMASRTPESLSRMVARELLLQMAFHPEVENLGPMTLRVLAPRMKHIDTHSSGYQKSVSGVTEWFPKEEQRVALAQSDLDGFFDLALDDHGAETREDLVEKLISEGKEWLPSHFSNISSLEDWEALLARHEFEMTLFHPDERLTVRQRWQALYDPLPAREVTPSPPPPPPPPRPRTGAPGTRPARPLLPAPTWNPRDYAHYLPAEAHQVFWRRVLEAAAGEETTYLLFYQNDEGLQVARVSEQDYRDALQVRGTAQVPGPLGGHFFFEDLARGEHMEILPVQLQLSVEVDHRVRGFISWLAELTPSDPSFPDIQVMQAFMIFLPLAEQAKAAFDQMFERLLARPSRRALRDDLNRLIREHGAAIARYRNYYSNMGPWHFLVPTLQGLAQTAASDEALLSRLEKVRDLLEWHRDLPADLVRPLQEAVRRLEGSADRSTDAYMECVHTFVAAWPEAMRRDAERLRTMLPSGANFQALAEAPDFVHTNHLDLLAFGQRMRGADRQSVESLSRFYPNAARVMDNPELEPIQRILRIIVSPGLFYVLTAPELMLGPVLGPLVTLLNQQSRNLRNPRRRAGATQKLLQLYIENQNEIIWRLKEKEGDEGYHWVENALPETMPRRFVLSSEFPELEAITFQEMDRYWFYLYVMGVSQGTADSFSVSVARDGLWENLIIPRDRIITRDVTGLGAVPIGIQGNDGRVYFRQNLYHSGLIERVGGLPRGDGEIEINDAWGRPITVREEDIKGEVTHVADFKRRYPAKVKRLRFLGMALNEPAFKDIRPILMMIFNTVLGHGATDTAPYVEFDQFVDSYPNQQRLAARAPVVRRRIIEIYRQIRPNLPRLIDGERFAEFFRG